MENFEKTKKIEFFCHPSKILHNTHMRSHKKFWAKKMIFRGAFGGGLSERKKIQSGVWCARLQKVAVDRRIIRRLNVSEDPNFTKV